MRRAFQPICGDFFGDPAKRERARRWNDIAAARAELGLILAESKALVVPMPRRCVESLLGWFAAVDDGEEVTLGCRLEIEDRIQTMIDCLDDLDHDADLEAEPSEPGSDDEEEIWVA